MNVYESASSLLKGQVSDCGNHSVHPQPTQATLMSLAALLRCVCGHRPQPAADLHRTERFTVSNYSSSAQESQPGTTDTSESH